MKGKKMLNTYFVEGGVGKCTAFTALIPQLKKKSEVQIYTPYLGCFGGNPDVKIAFEGTIPLTHPDIMASDNLYYSEPYKSNFQFGKQHLIESYCELHGVKFKSSMKPKIYTEQYKEKVAEWLKVNKIGKYILIQLSGGQPQMGFNPNNQYTNINPNTIGSSILGNRPEDYSSDIFTNLRYEDLKMAHTIDDSISVSAQNYRDKDVNSGMETLKTERSIEIQPQSIGDASKQLTIEERTQNDEDIGRAYRLARQQEIIAKKNNDWWSSLRLIK